MKQIVANYTFSASGKTVTLTDYGTIRLDRLQLIVDNTTNKVLFNFADPTLSHATVATNVITLSALQGGESNGDSLQIIYDTLTGDPTYDSSPVTLTSFLAGENTSANRMMVEQFFHPLTSSTAGTTALQVIPGFLHRILATGGSSGTVKVYDGVDATGTLIADYDGVNFFDHEINAVLAVGLTVVASAATKLTFMVR